MFNNHPEPWWNTAMAMKPATNAPAIDPVTNTLLSPFDFVSSISPPL